MTPFELAVVADLLLEAADRHAEHTATDFLVPDDEAHREILHRAARLEHGEGDAGPSLQASPTGDGSRVTQDYVLMRYLAARCEALAGRRTAEVPGTRLDAAERALLSRLLGELARDEFGEYAHDDANPDFTLDSTPAHREFLSAVLEGAGLAAQASMVRGRSEGDAALATLAVHVLAYLARRCLEAAPEEAGAAPQDLRPRASGPAPAGLAPLGLSKGWRNAKALAADARAHAEHFRGQEQQDLANLALYAEGGNPFKDIVDRSKPLEGPKFLAVASALTGPRLVAREEAAERMYAGRPEAEWLPAFERAVTLDYWDWCINCQAWGTWIVSWPDRPVRLMAECLTLGWVDHARTVAESTRALYERRLLGAVQRKDSQPLNHWLLRLCFDHWDMPFNGWGKSRHPEFDPKNVWARGECLGEPVLNSLFDHWQAPDLAPMHEHLVWLCDYYTHRTRAKQFIDIGPDHLLARFPALILAWQRLRECRGLSFPAIDHPLMQAPQARLLRARPLHADELLDRVLERLRREEQPDLGSGYPSAIRFVESRAKA